MTRPWCGSARTRHGGRPARQAATLQRPARPQAASHAGARVGPAHVRSKCKQPVSLRGRARGAAQHGQPMAAGSLEQSYRAAYGPNRTDPVPESQHRVPISRRPQSDVNSLSGTDIAASHPGRILMYVMLRLLDANERSKRQRKSRQPQARWARADPSAASGTLGRAILHIDR